MFWQKLFTPKAKFVAVGETNAGGLFRRIIFVFAFLVVTFGLSALVFSGTKDLLGLAEVLAVGAVFVSIFLILTLVFSSAEAFLLGLVATAVVLAPLFSTLSLLQWLLFVTLGFILLFLAGLRAMGRTQNSLQFSSTEAMRAAKSFLVLFLTLVLSLYSSAGLLNAREFPITEESVYSFFRPSEPIVQQFYPKFNFRMTMTEFFQMVFVKQKQNLNIENLVPNFGNTSTSETLQNLGVNFDFSSAETEIERQAQASFFAQASALMGRDVAPDERLSELVQSWLQAKYDSSSGENKSLFGGIIFLIVFLVIWGTLGLASFLLNLVFWLVFELFSLAGLVRITTMTVEKEVLTI